MGLGINAQPFSKDTSFVSHFDFRAQNAAVYNIHEGALGKILIGGNFQFNNGQTPHHGIVSYNRDGSLNPNYTASFNGGSIGYIIQLNDSVHYLGNSLIGFLMDSLGQNASPAWRSNILSSIQCNEGRPYFFKDGSMLYSTFQSSSTGLPCDVYLPPDTFPGSYLLKIQPNGFWDSTFNVSISGSAGPSLIVEHDSDRLYLIGKPRRFTHYEGKAVNGLCRIFKDGRLDTTFQSPIKDTTAINSFTIKKIDSDGSIFLLGVFHLRGYSQRFTLVKLNSNGSLDNWFMNFSGPTDTIYNLNAVNTIVETSDGGYLVGGSFNNYQNYPIRNLAKIDSVGKVEPQYFQGLGPDSSAVNGFIISSVNSIVRSKFGGYYIGGDFLRHNGLPSQPIYRIYDLQNGVGIKEQNIKTKNYRLYPNPATNQVKLAFKVNRNEQFSFLLYDLQGRLVQEQVLQTGTKHLIELEQLKQGLYLYQIRNETGEFLSGKLVVE